MHSYLGTMTSTAQAALAAVTTAQAKKRAASKDVRESAAQDRRHGHRAQLMVVLAALPAATVVIIPISILV